MRARSCERQLLLDLVREQRMTLAVGMWIVVGAVVAPRTAPADRRGDGAVPGQRRLLGVREIPARQCGGVDEGGAVLLVGLRERRVEVVAEHGRGDGGAPLD